MAGDCQLVLKACFVRIRADQSGILAPLRLYLQFDPVPFHQHLACCVYGSRPSELSRDHIPDPRTAMRKDQNQIVLLGDCAVEGVLATWDDIETV